MIYSEEYPKYKGLIYSLVKNYAHAHNFNDCAQAAQLGFLNALKTYKSNKRASLGTWVYISVRKQLQTQVNSEFVVNCHSETRKKQPKEIRSEINENTLKTDKTPYDILIEKDKNSEIATIISMLSKKLTKLERRVFIDFYIKNYKIDRIKKKYKIPHIDNLFTKFKALLDKARNELV